MPARPLLVLTPSGTALQAALPRPAARYGGQWAWWQAGLMWLVMIAFWGVLIWAAYALITSVTRKPPDTGHGGDARAILDQRLARGEIDAEEYQRLRELITSGDHQSPAGTGSAR